MQITNTQQFRLAIVPKNKRGGPAKLDGTPVWNVSDDTILSLKVEDDGLSALVLAQGPTGTASVSATGDADLGEGVKSISWTLEVEVIAGEAIAGEFEAGVAEEQAE